MSKKIDLHIHTNKSDGDFSPKEIINQAEERGVMTIAIADHDTVEAYTQDLFNYAKSKNINIIKAVEISAKNNKVGVHVLGYNIDINNRELKNKLYSLRNARHKYLYDVSTKLNELGYEVNVEELDKIEAVTKAHISRNIIENKNNKELLIKNFNHIPKMGEFIESIMNEGCPAYVKKETITPKEAAKLIRKAGGKVILAHPVAYQYEDGLSDVEVMKIIEEIEADGIEANYIYIDRNNNKINEIEKWRRIAKDNKLIVTLGSDFHNRDGIRPDIGLINEQIELSDQYIENVLDNLLKDCSK